MVMAYFTLSLVEVNDTDHLLTGDEHIVFDEMPIGFLLRDFWAWSSSDLLNNTLRGGFAEFLVSAALGLKLDTPRTDWTPFDVLYPLNCKSNIRVEVKSAAYLQAWEQQRLSRIQFSIRPTKAWYAESGYEDEVRHQSDVYVFCIYACKDRKHSDPLKLDDWEFYVLPTSVLNIRCAAQQSISLPVLLTLEPTKTTYEGIKDAVISAYKLPVFIHPLLEIDI